MLRLRQVVNKTQIGLQCSTVIAIGRRHPRQEPITTLRCAVWHAPAGTPPRTTQIVNSFTGRTTQNMTHSPPPNGNYSAPPNIKVKCASRFGTRRVGVRRGWSSLVRQTATSERSEGHRLRSTCLHFRIPPFPQFAGHFLLPSTPTPLC